MKKKRAKKRPKEKEIERMSLRALMEELLELRSHAKNIVAAVDDLEWRIYATGLSERGPLTEANDDIPF